ncbi:MAG: DMT family transporter [Pseudomonadota bacterium]
MTALTTSGEFYSLLVAFIWAIAVVMFRASGASTPPVALNLFKNSFAVVLLVPTMLLWGIPFLPPGNGWADAGILLASGALGIGVADTLFFASLNRLGAGRSAVVDSLYSPCIVLFAFFYLSEPISITLLVAVGLMVSAILLIAGKADPDDTPIPRKDLRTGILYGVLAMAGMAAGIVVAKPVLNRADVLWSAVVRLTGGVGFLVLYLGHGRSRREILRAFRPGRHWRLLVPASFIGTYLAMMIWIAGMKYTNTSIAGVLNQTSVLLVPILAAFFLKEPLTKRKIAAILLGFAGAALAAL